MIFFPIDTFCTGTFPVLSFQGYGRENLFHNVLTRTISFPFYFLPSNSFPTFAFHTGLLNYDVTRQDMAEIAANKVTNLESGGNAWSKYNKVYRYRNFLRDLSNIGNCMPNFIRPEEVPDLPDLDDYTDLAN